VIPHLLGRQAHGSRFRLATLASLLGRFDPMIDRVSHQMDQWIAKLLDHGLVEFGLFTRKHQIDVLAKLARHVACDAGIFLEQSTDGLHARLHDRVLQIADEQVEVADGLVECAKRILIVFARKYVGSKTIQAVLGETDFAG